jgi:hypothetical protein
MSIPAEKSFFARYRAVSGRIRILFHPAQLDVRAGLSLIQRIEPQPDVPSMQGSRKATAHIFIAPGLSVNCRRMDLALVIIAGV